MIINAIYLYFVAGHKSRLVFSMEFFFVLPSICIYQLHEFIRQRNNEIESTIHSVKTREKLFLNFLELMRKEFRPC